MSERYDLLKWGYEEEFYCDVGYLIDNETGKTDDFVPYNYVGKYINLMNQLDYENKQLKQENKRLKCEIMSLEKLLEIFQNKIEW